MLGHLFEASAMTVRVTQSPIGPLKITVDDGFLTEIAWFNSAEPTPQPSKDQHPLLDQVEAALTEYFLSTNSHWSLPIRLHGTEFQKQVWQALTDIPPGKTASYADIAATIGKPAAVRAVGAAIGKNPIPIVIPCHRVIGSNGALTGFSGGLDKKKWLLKHESSGWVV